MSGIANCETNTRLRSALYQNFRDGQVYPIQGLPRPNAAVDLKDCVKVAARNSLPPVMNSTSSELVGDSFDPEQGPTGLGVPFSGSGPMV